jgi:pyruvate dehydrogenase E1 component beta subunit
MLHYTSGGQFKVPVVIRGPGGVGRQLGAEHSQRLESYFQSIPGVQLVAVSTVANAKALLKSVSKWGEAVTAGGWVAGCDRSLVYVCVWGWV